MAAAAVREARSSPAALPVNDSLKTALELAVVLAESACSLATAFALDRPGDFTLPEAVPRTTGEQAQIRAIAPLYLAAQLEEATLVPAVETLTALAISGGLQTDLGPSVRMIEGFWHQRNERFHENERRAFFAGLFGADDPSAITGARRGQPVLNGAFEDLMIDLCEALYRLDEDSAGNGTGLQQQTRVQVGARSLSENLLNKAGGMTAFAAGEILNTVQLAVEILQQPSVQHAFGSNSLWAAVRAIARRFLHKDPDVTSYVARGKSGLIILSWLADLFPLLDSGQALVTLDHPVIGAATEWLQASLTIREAGMRAGG